MRVPTPWCAALLILAGATVADPALSQDTGSSDRYVLGPEDVVAISVWLHPELERTVKLNSQGTITFPPIGEIKAAGLTPTGLATRIGDRLSTYLRQTATVTVTVTEYASNSVVVTGAVARPGRYGFEVIPPLLDVLDAAGGATPEADLSRLQILRREGGSRNVINVDVPAALRQPGTVLAALRAGDTIIVPLVAGGTLPPGTGVSVLGEVVHPGVYGVGDGQDVWSVLAASGGLTPRGDLTAVRVLRHKSDRQSVSTLNLRDVLEAGGGSPYLVYSGDIVFVEPTGRGFWGATGRGFSTLLSVSRDVLNIIVLAVLLDNNTNNPK